MSKQLGFTGTVAGITYTDRKAFEKAARDAGYRLGANRTGDWRVGMPVQIETPDGEKIAGQVWTKGQYPRCGWVWVALDNGRFAKVWTDGGRAEYADGETAGRVAA